ncbi:MAG TPA: DNA polymerase III subunit delta [Thermoleophilaceae bacterium]|nr:DNA polymerase III subunit delta [Thermoleophilaceae bacterium]
MADLKPAYLVSGDDDAKIDSWRARVRRRAEEERGPGGLESFDAGASDPGEVAAALATLSFEAGTRYLLVDQVQVWKQVEPMESALAALPPDTVLVLIARGKPRAPLASAVKAAGGETREYSAPKPWQLPKWAVERAGEEGVQLDSETAKELISIVGSSQQRLIREIEKLALAVHPATRIGLEDIERLATGDASPGAYDLADALAAGDRREALAIAERITAREGRPGGLLWGIARRLREVHRAVVMLESGVPEQKVGESINRQPWLAKKIVARAKKADRATLERALCALAEAEVELRGGSELALDEDSAFSLALARATA